MAKLQQREINALVSEISKKINGPIRERNEIREAEATERFEQSDLAVDFKALFSKKDLEDYYVRSAYKYLRNKVLDKIKLEQIVGDSEIERRIILMNIEVTNVDDLINKVVEHFKK